MKLAQPLPRAAGGQLGDRRSRAAHDDGRLGCGALDPGGQPGHAGGRPDRDLDADVPRAPGADVLEVPLARDARADPGRVLRDRARGRADRAPVRAAALPPARLRAHRRPRDRALADPRRRAGRQARPRATWRSTSAAPRATAPATSARTSRSRSRTSIRASRPRSRAGSTSPRSRASTCSSPTGSCARSPGSSWRSRPSAASPRTPTTARRRAPASRRSTSATRRGWRGRGSPPRVTAVASALYLRFGPRRRGRRRR